MTIEAWLTLIGLVITVVVTVGSATWVLANKMNVNRGAWTGVVERFRSEAAKELRDVEDKWQTKLDAAYLHFGEGPSALREKVNQFEIYVRDHYVAKPDYNRDQDQILLTIRAIQQTIETGFNSMNKKLDDFMKEVRAP